MKRIVMLALCAVFLIAVHAQTRRALVIGLGKQEDPAWQKINGDKDVPLVKEMLGRAGFDKQHIRTLVNEQATKAAIVQAFMTMAQTAKKGDIVYIHFSGHGQQMRDRNGDEADGLDRKSGSILRLWFPYAPPYQRPAPTSDMHVRMPGNPVD